MTAFISTVNLVLYPWASGWHASADTQNLQFIPFGG